MHRRESAAVHAQAVKYRQQSVKGPNEMRACILRATPIAICAWFAATAAGAGAASAEFPTPLPAETIPKVETLPAKYPTTWAFLNYAGDRIEIRNVGSDSREVKGQLQAHDSATLLVPDKRPELYVADTVWSRGSRGTRTDFITIYDTHPGAGNRRLRARAPRAGKRHGKICRRQQQRRSAATSAQGRRPK